MQQGDGGEGNDLLNSEVCRVTVSMDDVKKVMQEMFEYWLGQVIVIRSYTLEGMGEYTHLGQTIISNIAKKSLISVNIIGLSLVQLHILFI